jgi:hypothetical protein
MTDPTLTALRMVSDSIVDEMPPAVRESLDNIITTLARHLGESPEAWRGGALVALEMLHGIIESAETGIQDNTQRFMLLVLTRFISLPYAHQALESMKHEAGA